MWLIDTDYSVWTLSVSKWFNLSELTQDPSWKKLQDITFCAGDPSATDEAMFVVNQQTGAVGGRIGGGGFDFYPLKVSRKLKSVNSYKDPRPLFVRGFKSGDMIALKACNGKYLTSEWYSAIYGTYIKAIFDGISDENCRYVVYQAPGGDQFFYLRRDTEPRWQYYLAMIDGYIKPEGPLPPDNPNGWCVFEVVDLGAGKIAIKAFNGRFWRYSKDDYIKADEDGFDATNIFTYEELTPK